MTTEELIAKFKARMQPAIDYYEAFLWTDNDRHRLINENWQVTKRAMQAEAEVKRLKRELEDLRNTPELLFPR